ncbi:MAG: hypothetical protein ACJAWX_003182, partial [Algoriphagus sp.]
LWQACNPQTEHNLQDLKKSGIHVLQHPYQLRD